MDENAMLQLLKDNPERGLQAIIETYGPAVHKICSSYLSGCRQEDIEEAESDVYVKLWKHRESVIINETYSLKSYLFAIARNTCIDRQRSAQPETLSLEAVSENGFEPAAPDQTEGTVAAGWLSDTVRSAVAELDEPARSIYYARYYEGLSIREVAAKLNLPEKKVENTLRRSRKKLRSILVKKGVTSYEEFEG